MNRWQGRLAVVTGASSGIGEAIAIELAKHGVIVAGLARKFDRLQNLANRLNTGNEKKFHAFKCDVSKESEIVDCFKLVQDSLGPISILVNNAGRLTAATLLDCTAEHINEIFQTNVSGLVLCGKEALKSMINNDIDDGHIININSVAGHNLLNWSEPSPYTLYTASKHAVTVITESLRRELRKRGKKIKTTSLSPGLVMTEMIQDLNFGPAGAGVMPLEASDIAGACIAVLSTPPNVLITELTIMPVSDEY